MAARGVATTDLNARMILELQQRYGGLVTAVLAQTAEHIGNGMSADKRTFWDQGRTSEQE
jgi:hypothetical protein